MFIFAGLLLSEHFNLETSPSIKYIIKNKTMWGTVWEKLTRDEQGLCEH